MFKITVRNLKKVVLFNNKHKPILRKLGVFSKNKPYYGHDRSLNLSTQNKLKSINDKSSSKINKYFSKDCTVPPTKSTGKSNDILKSSPEDSKNIHDTEILNSTSIKEGGKDQNQKIEILNEPSLVEAGYSENRTNSQNDELENKNPVLKTQGGDHDIHKNDEISTSNPFPEIKQQTKNASILLQKRTGTSKINENVSSSQLTPLLINTFVSSTSKDDKKSKKPTGYGSLIDRFITRTTQKNKLDTVKKDDTTEKWDTKNYFNKAASSSLTKKYGFEDSPSDAVPTKNYLSEVAKNEDLQIKKDDFNVAKSEDLQIQKDDFNVATSENSQIKKDDFKVVTSENSQIEKDNAKVDTSENSQIEKDNAKVDTMIFSQSAPSFTNMPTDRKEAATDQINADLYASARDRLSDIGPLMCKSNSLEKVNFGNARCHKSDEPLIRIRDLKTSPENYTPGKPQPYTQTPQQYQNAWFPGYPQNWTAGPQQHWTAGPQQNWTAGPQQNRTAVPQQNWTAGPQQNWTVAPSQNWTMRFDKSQQSPWLNNSNVQPSSMGTWPPNPYRAPGHSHPSNPAHFQYVPPNKP